MSKKKQFVRGAWLRTIDELTESKFIEKSGGMEKLERFREYPFVSLVLDNPDEPQLVGHLNGRTIALVMDTHGHQKFQTMEWKSNER